MQNFHDEMKIASSGNKRNKVFALLEPELKVGAPADARGKNIVVEVAETMTVQAFHVVGCNAKFVHPATFVKSNQVIRRFPRFGQIFFLTISGNHCIPIVDSQCLQVALTGN